MQDSVIVNFIGNQRLTHQSGAMFDKTHSQMLGKVESGGGPIFKVVLEC